MITIGFYHIFIAICVYLLNKRVNGFRSKRVVIGCILVPLAGVYCLYRMITGYWAGVAELRFNPVKWEK